MAKRNKSGTEKPAEKAGAAKQTFSIKAPAAMSVLLAGDFTEWQSKAIPLKKESGDIWSVSVELAPGTYLYRFIVDGQWRDDPACTLRVPSPYGGDNSVRKVD